MNRKGFYKEQPDETLCRICGQCITDVNSHKSCLRTAFNLPENHRFDFEGTMQVLRSTGKMLSWGQPNPGVFRFEFSHRQHALLVEAKTDVTNVLLMVLLTELATPAEPPVTLSSKPIPEGKASYAKRRSSRRTP